jgi:DNA-directed RNA polymerase subunit M/transcription elongation factor TFIIS
MFTTDFSAVEQRKKMESEKEKCGNCGKTFSLKGKSYDRKSFNANLKLTIYKTIKDVLEEEFDVKLTPDEKRKRFLCNSCSRSLLSIAKSTHSRK